MTHIDNEPGPGRNYGETAILHILHILASFLEYKKAIFSNPFPPIKNSPQTKKKSFPGFWNI